MLRLSKICVSVIIGLGIIVSSMSVAKEDAKKPAKPSLGQLKPLTKKSEAWVETKSGLRYLDVKVGSKKPNEIANRNNHPNVEVHYVGTLTSGKKFDSSRDRNETFKFPLGMGRVIEGWEEGIDGMGVGGVRKLEIPAKLGYGSREMGDIPANSTLLFEVELIKILPSSANL